jgi:hypothetical protein
MYGPYFGYNQAQQLSSTNIDLDIKRGAYHCESGRNLSTIFKYQAPPPSVSAVLHPGRDRGQPGTLNLITMHPRACLTPSDQLQ